MRSPDYTRLAAQLPAVYQEDQSCDAQRTRSSAWPTS